MLGLSAFIVAVAFGADVTQELAWDVMVRGKVVGERTVTVKYVNENQGMRRILEGETEIDAAIAGFPFTWRQRFTAHAAGRAPASFHSVVMENGEPREVQGRLAGGTWLVSLVEGGQSRSWELSGSEIQLSTADLFDPGTHVPLDKFVTVKMLSAETGDVWEQQVERLGPSTVTIDGREVPVEGIAVDPPQGRATFHYTSDGVLVRYAYRWMGLQLEALLRDPPPPGVDDVPVPMLEVIGEVDL
jgi:hypothetical protein